MDNKVFWILNLYSDLWLAEVMKNIDWLVSYSHLALYPSQPSSWCVCQCGVCCVDLCSGLCCPHSLNTQQLCQWRVTITDTKHTTSVSTTHHNHWHNVTNQQPFFRNYYGKFKTIFITFQGTSSPYPSHIPKGMRVRDVKEVHLIDSVETVETTYRDCRDWWSCWCWPCVPACRYSGSPRGSGPSSVPQMGRCCPVGQSSPSDSVRSHPHALPSSESETISSILAVTDRFIYFWSQMYILIYLT